MFVSLFSGFFTSLGLISVIGAQNAFVLRQGLRREFVGMVVAACVLSDTLLIAIGVGGAGGGVHLTPWVSGIIRWFAVAFLFFYGLLRFCSAWKGQEALLPTETVKTISAMQTLATCLVMTWANPHVYLDTVILIGSISVQYAPHTWLFGAGASLASLVFFVTLGFGAQRLAPLFSRPRAWVVFEILTGLIMWIMASVLALQTS